DPLVILDGAHNAMAAEALAIEIVHLSFRNLFLVVGMVAGHDPDDVLRHLAPRAHAVIATRPTWDKGRPAEEIAATARKYCGNVQIVDQPQRAAKRAIASASADDLVVVTG